MVVIVKDKDFDNSKPIQTMSESAGDTSIFIKWFHSCNADGDAGEPIFIVAVKSMAENVSFHDLSMLLLLL